MTVLELRDAVRGNVVAWWHRVWPPIVLALALIVDVAWVGLLGYALVKLL
jgi:hypothetical protein